jgi:serine/threonine protein phosphatase PrpC
LSYQDAVDQVSEHRAAGKDPLETAELLVKLSLDRGSKDNITTIVVYLTYE